MLFYAPYFGEESHKECDLLESINHALFSIYFNDKKYDSCGTEREDNKKKMIISIGPQAITEAPHFFLVFHKCSGYGVLLKITF